MFWISLAYLQHEANLVYTRNFVWSAKANPDKICARIKSKEEGSYFAATLENVYCFVVNKDKDNYGLKHYSHS